MKTTTTPKPAAELPEAIAGLLRGQFSELLDGNIPGIAEELQSSEDAKLSVSVGFKLTLAGPKVYVDSAVAYSRKFKGEAQGVVELADPNQPELLK